MPASRRRSTPRRDEHGRAFAGSQLQMQIWANARRERLSGAVCTALGLPTDSAAEWVSPVPPEFGEFKDGAFLRALGLEAGRSALRQFWPQGGPVWDGLAIVGLPDGQKTYVLVEAKSYPDEVIGSGCQAVEGGPSRILIESSLNATATWLGVPLKEVWLGDLYQSANRLAHVYFLREKLGKDARLVNLCFENDPHRPTTRTAWDDAHSTFKASLGLTGVQVPWLAEVYLPAADRSELLALAI